MKRKFKYGLILMVVLSMLFCFTGCSKEEDEDDDDRPRRTRPSITLADDDNKGSDDKNNNNDRDDQNQDNQNGDNQSSNNGQGIFDNFGTNNSKYGADLSIITVGDDKLVIVITGDACKGVAPLGQYEDGHDYFEIRNDESSLLISCYSSYAYIYQGDKETYYNDYKKGITANSNSYILEIEKEGINSYYDFGNDLTLYLSTSGDYIEIANYKTKNIVREGTAEDVNRVLVDVKKNAVAKNPAKAAWEGVFITESYSDVFGLAEVEITEGGMIHIHTTIGDSEKDYFLEEESFDSSTYDYGTYEYAMARDYSAGNSIDSSFTYYNDYGTVRLQYNYSDYNNYEDNMYIYFKPFYGGYHIAPSDYDDSDRYGYMSETYPQDKKYMVPKTDDYMMRVSKSSAWNGNDSVSCMYTVLASFDANGHVCAQVSRYVFDSVSDAASVYAYYTGNGYTAYQINQEDNVLYMTTVDEEYYLDSDKSQYSYRPSQFYLNCHYLYFYDNEEYLDYAYYSKPFTEDDFQMELDDIVFWGSIENGEHACTDTRNVSVGIYVDECDLEFYVYDYSTDSYNNRMHSSLGYLKMKGRSAVAIAYDIWEGYIYIKEFDADSDICVITEYQFKVDDWKNIPVTFDNYKKKEADNVITHKFDMTKTMAH